MSDEAWRSRVHGLIARVPADALLFPSEHGWSLPSVEFESFSDHDLRPARRAFEELLGTPVAVQRYAARHLDREQRLLEVVDVLEPLDADWEPPVSAQWMDRAAISSLPLGHEEHREILLRALNELETGAVPPERPPWAREGWLDEAEAWIEESLTALRRPPAGRAEQIRAWCLSSLLRVPTADGNVFFKATAGSPLFAEEGSVMQGLAQLFPSTGRFQRPESAYAHSRASHQRTSS